MIESIRDLTIKYISDVLVPEHFLRLFVTVPSASDDIISILLAAGNEDFQGIHIKQAQCLLHTTLWQYLFKVSFLSADVVHCKCK